MPLTKALTLGKAEYLGYIYGRYTTGEYALGEIQTWNWALMLSCNKWRYSHWILTLPTLMLMTAQCSSSFKAEFASPQNLLMNESFEAGKEPWFALVTPNWESFEITDRSANGGRHSAYLGLRAPSSTVGTKIVGVVQEVSPSEFPRRLSGFYHVEHWRRGTQKQYLQVVIIVFADPTNKPFPNYQLRYVLSGIDRPPLQIVNAKYVFSGISEVQQGRWKNFDFDLHSDFRRHWGQVPEGFTKLRILFEVRYDEKTAGEDEVRADVYYDDLYLGE